MALKKWSMTAINDVFDELKDENKRLLNELLFADKCLKLFIEYKTFVELLFGKYGQSFDTKDADYYHQELTKSAEEVLTSDNQWITNGVKNKGSDDNKDNANNRIQQIPNQSKSVVKLLDEDNTDGADPEYNPNSDIERNELQNVNKSKVKSNRIRQKRPFLEDICELCGQSLESEDTRRSHIKTHLDRYKYKEANKPTEYVCDHMGCDYRSANQQYFISHINGHKGHKPFECSSCGQSFPNQFRLRVHIECNHKVLTQPLVCDIDGCGKQFDTEYRFTRHQYRTHTMPKKYVCSQPNCEMRFAERRHLKSHELNHLTDRPFKCTVEGCSKSFAEEKLVRLHMISHSSDRNHRCPHEECGKLFKTARAVQKHITGLHAEKQLSCDWPGCDYKASFKYKIENHRLVHSDVKQFRCDWDGCGKSFKVKERLNNHLNHVHKGIKKFECHWPGCQYRCTTSGNLKLHMTVHSTDLNHACDWPECGKRFKSKNSLKVHQKTHTNG